MTILNYNKTKIIQIWKFLLIHTVSDELCIKPLYVFNSVFLLNDLRMDAVNWPHFNGTIGSQSPWHWSTGKSLLPTVAYNTKITYLYLVINTNKLFMLTAGKDLCKGIQHDKAITPANGLS